MLVNVGHTEMSLGALRERERGREGERESEREKGRESENNNTSNNETASKGEVVVTSNDNIVY